MRAAPCSFADGAAIPATVTLLQQTRSPETPEWIDAAAAKGDETAKLLQPFFAKKLAEKAR